MKLSNHIYMMESDWGIKIGMSSHPANRAVQLTQQTGIKHRLLAAFRTPRWAKWAERDIHNALSQYRVHGEYFAISEKRARAAIGQVACEELKDLPPPQQQKQIRMTAELRARFEAAQDATGLTADAFVEKLLDQHEGKGGITKAEVIAWIERNAG